MKPTCSNCRFWEIRFPEEKSKRDDIPEWRKASCKRHAPVIPMTYYHHLHDIETRWPTTEAADGCGDFEVFNQGKENA
jgi:hypothetical protein